MSKKRRWWGGKQEQSLFPNTVKQHNKKIERAMDEDGFYLDEEDYGYSSYNWDWDRKLLGKEQEITGDTKKDRLAKYDYNQKEYTTQYKAYERTGIWGGYVRQPQLSYKYVQQMANALSIQHNIKVEVGNKWEVDLLKRTLTYNPASLIYGTKSELLATLMHEIGKLRYVTHSSLLQNKYLSMYKMPAMEVLSIYEDLRTDFLMLKAYESASEIYESIIPTIETQVENYMLHGKRFRELVGYIPERLLREEILGNHSYNTPDRQIHPEDPKLQQELLEVFGIRELDEVERRINNLKVESEKKGTIYEWCGEMLSVMYDLDEQNHPKFENITDKVQKCILFIEDSKKTVNSQALVDYLDNNTYPIVEDLMKDTQDKTEELEKAFPNMPQQWKQEIIRRIKQQMLSGTDGDGGGVNVDPNGNVKSRSSSKSSSTIPPEWSSGDYKTLKDSVSMEIKQLVNRLTFIRREELTVRYQADQKRGKLNSRKLYKSSTGSRRLFKHKLENTDTIQSFAFSVLLDVSGSMSGARIAHCTRALIIFSEVFKKMNIPFELVTFSNGATVIKPFNKDIDKTIEKKIGGLVNADGGGTNMDQGLKALKIHSQPEKNKIVIVLTDGGVGSAREFDTRFFIPWQKQGIKSVGFGVECEAEMAKLCQGNSKVLNNASTLPVEFSSLLKTLIRR